MALAYDVVATRRDVTGAAPPTFHAFELSAPSPVDPAIVASNRSFVPLFLDRTATTVVFADVPLDLPRQVFAFVEAHRAATRLIVVDPDELDEIAAPLPALRQPVFVFNTSRCGSSVLHRAFNAVPGVTSISELSVIADLAQLAHDDRPLALRLLGSTLRITAAHYGGIAAFKHLAPCVRIADLHRLAFPDARLLFLYRNAFDWAASWQRFRELAGRHDVEMAMWLDAMDAAADAIEGGVSMTPLRYEDLDMTPGATVSALFELFGWPAAAVDEALRAFDSDAQAGTALARIDGRPNPYRLTAEQRRSVRRQLDAHRPSWDAAPVLPGTLRVGPR